IVLHPDLNKVLKPLEQVLSEKRFETLQPTSVHCTFSAATREILIRLLLDTGLPDLPDRHAGGQVRLHAPQDLKKTGEELYNRLKETTDSMAGLVLSPRHGLRQTFGRDFIEEHLGEFRYRISDGSFSQIGPE